VTVRLPTTIGRELGRAVIGNEDTEMGLIWCMQISARPLLIVDGPAIEVSAVGRAVGIRPFSLWTWLVGVVLDMILQLSVSVLLRG
jgi:hypothetical protein